MTFTFVGLVAGTFVALQYSDSLFKWMVDRQSAKVLVVFRVAMFRVCAASSDFCVVVRALHKTLVENRMNGSVDHTVIAFI